MPLFSMIEIFIYYSRVMKDMNIAKLEDFKDYNAWLAEFDKFQPGVYGRLAKAEAAYKDAYEILSNLTPENRRYLAGMINASEDRGIVDLTEDDFDGVRLADESKEDLETRYGIKIFPKTLVVPKSRGKKGLMYKLDGDPTEMGITLISVSYPFDAIGGLSFMREDVYSAHEDIHGGNEVYRPHDGIEFGILDEISAARDDIRRNDPKMGTWEKVVKETIKHSFPAIAEWYEITPQEMKKYEGPFKKVVETAQYLEGNNVPQAVISRALLSTRDIADFNSLRLG